MYNIRVVARNGVTARKMKAASEARIEESRCDYFVSLHPLLFTRQHAAHDAAKMLRKSGGS